MVLVLQKKRKRTEKKQREKEKRDKERDREKGGERDRDRGRDGGRSSGSRGGYKKRGRKIRPFESLHDEADDNDTFMAKMQAEFGELLTW